MKSVLKQSLQINTSNLLTVAGLSIAFAVVMVIVIQLKFDFTFDRNFHKASEISILNQYRTYDDGYNGSSSPVGNNRSLFNLNYANRLVEVYPEVKEMALVATFPGKFKNPKASDEDLIQAHIGMASNNFIDFFGLKVISGNASEALSSEGKALISQKIALSFFGEDMPIGKSIFTARGQELIVTAVYEDLPNNCSLKNAVYTFLSLGDKTNENYRIFVRMEERDRESFVKKINADSSLDLSYVKADDPTSARAVESIKLIDLHLFRPEISDTNTSSINMVLSLLGLGIVLLLIAFINLVNFIIAQVPRRVRDVNIRKIMGVDIWQLRLSIAFESVILAGIALLLAFVLVYLFKNSDLSVFISADLNFVDHCVLLGVVSALLFTATLLLALYPAHYLTSFETAITLNGSLSLSPKGVKIRNIMVVIQFVAAITFIIIALFIKLQHNYMQNYSWGMQKENIIYLPGQDLKTNIKNFGDELKQSPLISDYTNTAFLPGALHMSWYRNFRGKNIELWAWPVAPNFLAFFGVQVTAGNDFDTKDVSGTEMMIVNREFLTKYGFDESIIGSPFRCFSEGKIVGIAENVNFCPLYEPLAPMTFAIIHDEWHAKSNNDWVMVKLSGKDNLAAIHFIEKVWKQHSDKSFNLKFLDETLDNLYKHENDLSKLLSMFSIIAILIAIMGVYGIVVFNSRYKKKEIAIRKVNGATLFSIIVLLNTATIKQLFIAFALAVPLAYYIVEKWLASYIYKISIHVWVFLVAGVLVAIITLLTVLYQSAKTALTNPVEWLNRNQ